MSKYIDFNKERWNQVSKKKGNPYTIPISHEQLMEARNKPIEVALTVGKSVPIEWFENAKGNKLLGLACGGGQQGPLFSIKGYETTIMDYSEAQVDSDRLVADREELSLTTAQADMTKEFPFDDESFDLVTISFGLRNVTDKDAALRSMYRVLKKGGRLLILEFSKPVFEPFGKVYDLYSFTALPLMGKLVANDSESYQYLAESIRMHPDQRTLKGMMEDAGFVNCDYNNLTGGIVAVHRGFKK